MKEMKKQISSLRRSDVDAEGAHLHPGRAHVQPAIEREHGRHCGPPSFVQANLHLKKVDSNH